ncbi:stage II sporulation protein P [Seinonella peptonophila]|uniref:Stage II sporulation protein P n=1 Tax=Seinonella peptonophila TaxID=112248 RepID=A0A1M4V909_9BACL|nr:stage II sporulation protein P [Seinonella peptonophila]SHE65370.1 stage II sporulation protein P [Seinonella peptonophila]
MNRSPFATISFARPKVRRIFVLLFVGTAILFSMIGGFAMLQAESNVRQTEGSPLTNRVTPKTLLMVLGESIPYLDEQVNQSKDRILSRLFFELVTSINPKDPRTLLGRELPMFALYDANIIAASPGVDYTSIPVESPPPPDLEKAIISSTDDLERDESEQIKELGQPLVLVYHTHYWESYLSEVGTKQPSRAVSIDKKRNINQVGKRLAKRLQALHVGAIASQSQPKTNSRFAYRVSRKKIRQVMQQHPQLTYLIDVHRDSRPRNKTTIQIGGLSYARLSFVVGKSSSYYPQNRSLAKQLHQKINQLYPGLSSSVIEKPRTRGINGEYNQSLSPNSLLVEVGGVGNTFNEAYRSVDVLAKVLSKEVLETIPVMKAR